MTMRRMIADDDEHGTGPRSIRLSGLLAELVIEPVGEPVHAAAA